MSMQGLTSQDPLARHFPEGLTRRWFRLGGSMDVAMLIVLYFGYNDVKKFYGTLPGILAGLISILMMTPLIYGRVYTYLDLPYEWYIKYVLKDVLLDTEDTSWRARLRGAPPNPGVVTAIGPELGTLYADGTDKAYIFGSGSRLTADPFLDQAGSYAKVEDSIKRLAGRLGLSIGVGWQSHTRPPNMAEAEAEQAQTRHPGVYGPRALDPAHALQKLTADDKTDLVLNTILMEDYEIEAENTASGNESMVLSVQRTQKLQKAAKAGTLSTMDMDQQPIVKLARQAVKALTSVGVHDAVMATADDLKEFIRSARDVTNLGEYFALDPESQAREYGPQRKIIAEKTVCCIDGTWFATMMITGGPREIEIWRLRQLLSPEILWPSLAAPSETVGWKAEYRFINWVVTPFIIALRAGLNLTRSGEEGIDKERQREERQRKLYYSRWAQHLSILLAAAGSTREEVLAQYDLLEGNVRSLGFDFVQVKGRRRVVKAAWTATTCSNLL